jgi:hypothetical protein
MEHYLCCTVHAINGAPCNKLNIAADEKLFWESNISTSELLRTNYCLKVKKGKTSKMEHSSCGIVYGRGDMNKLLVSPITISKVWNKGCRRGGLLQVLGWWEQQPTRSRRNTTSLTVYAQTLRHHNHVCGGREVHIFLIVVYDRMWHAMKL